MAICPFAVWDQISGPVGPYVAGPFRIVHHTTEGNSYSSARTTFAAKQADPHFTVDSVSIHQHIDTGLASRALRHPAEGPQTNKLSAISIAIVAHGGKPKNQMTLAQVAKLCRWLEATHQIPSVWPSGYPNPPTPKGGNPGNHNRDLLSWTIQGGHYGHCHVPGNTHWDPGYTAQEVAMVMGQVMPAMNLVAQGENQMAGEPV